MGRQKNSSSATTSLCVHLKIGSIRIDFQQFLPVTQTMLGALFVMLHIALIISFQQKLISYRLIFSISSLQGIQLYNVIVVDDTDYNKFDVVDIAVVHEFEFEFNYFGFRFFG
jgi:hypothetical protein